MSSDFIAAIASVCGHSEDEIVRLHQTPLTEGLGNIQRDEPDILPLIKSITEIVTDRLTSSEFFYLRDLAFAFPFGSTLIPSEVLRSLLDWRRKRLKEEKDQSIKED